MKPIRNHQRSNDSAGTNQNQNNDRKLGGNKVMFHPAEEGIAKRKSGRWKALQDREDGTSKKRARLLRTDRMHSRLKAEVAVRLINCEVSKCYLWNIRNINLKISLYSLTAYGVYGVYRIPAVSNFIVSLTTIESYRQILKITLLYQEFLSE